MHFLFEKRQSISRGALVLVPVLSFFVSLILGGILLAVSGADPFATYAAMARGAFGSWRNFSETLVKAIPLMLTGLGVSIAFKMQFWNIGGRAIDARWRSGSVGGALRLTRLPETMVLPAALLLGMAAGALWAGIPAVLKAYIGVDETLTTLMLTMWPFCCPNISTTAPGVILTDTASRGRHSSRFLPGCRAGQYARASGTYLCAHCRNPAVVYLQPHTLGLRAAHHR